MTTSGSPRAPSRYGIRTTRLSSAAVKYTYTISGESGATAMPSSPPSPSGTTLGTVPTSETFPAADTNRIRAESRSVSNADPSGRKASPQGTSKPVATSSNDAGTTGPGSTVAVGVAV